MKIVPVQREMRRANEFTPLIVYTGQPYDAAMSDSLFLNLGKNNENAKIPPLLERRAAETHLRCFVVNKSQENQPQSRIRKYKNLSCFFAFAAG